MNADEAVRDARILRTFHPEDRTQDAKTAVALLDEVERLRAEHVGPDRVTVTREFLATARLDVIRAAARS